MGMGSRNGAARLLDTNPTRLRRLEGSGAIPAFTPVAAEPYFVVLEVHEALRAAGWSSEKIRRAFATVRSNNFPAGSRGVWEKQVNSLLVEWARIWPQLGDSAKADIVQKWGAPPSELIGGDYGNPPWEEES